MDAGRHQHHHQGYAWPPPNFAFDPSTDGSAEEDPIRRFYRHHLPRPPPPPPPPPPPHMPPTQSISIYSALIGPPTTPPAPHNSAPSRPTPPDPSSQSSRDDKKIIPTNPVNFREDVDICDQDLICMKTKDLNKLIKKNGLSKERARQLKQERRTLKNRGYAANCRVKRETEEENIKRSIQEMRDLAVNEKTMIIQTEEAIKNTKDRIEYWLRRSSEEVKKRIAEEIREELNPDEDVLHEFTFLYDKFENSSCSRPSSPTKGHEPAAPPPAALPLPPMPPQPRHPSLSLPHSSINSAAAASAALGIHGSQANVAAVAVAAAAAAAAASTFQYPTKHYF